MAYEDEADEHERLMRLRFALQRELDARTEADPRRRLLRETIGELDEQIARLRRRHRD